MTVARAKEAAVSPRAVLFFTAYAAFLALVVLASIRLRRVSPMSDSLLDVKFVLLLAVVPLARKYCPLKYYAEFGALTSAVLVGIGSLPTLISIAIITFLFLYPVHLLSNRLRRSGLSPRRAKILFAASVVILVFLFAIFKVYHSFHPAFLGGAWAQSQILALVGFSYFVFRAINFLHIQWILKFEEHSPWGLFYFLLFPPTLTSGPIQKYQDFRQQLAAPQALTRSLVWEATYRITRGFFRKLVLAFLLDTVVQKLMAVPSPNAYLSIVTIVLVYLYFYFDFAGYSDVAIGFGLLLGIRVPENFKNPFRATSVTEFWRNWHITLVDWFRDNVYIPLGGMKSGRLKAAFLAFVIMVLCGFFHGLTLSFLAWGCWHGTLLLVEALTGSGPMRPSMRHGPRYWARVVRTNAFVALASVFFLPASQSTFLLGGFTKWF